MKTVKQRVLDLVQKNKTAVSGDFHAFVRAAPSHICKSLNELVAEGIIVKGKKVGRGWQYTLTEAANCAIGMTGSKKKTTQKDEPAVRSFKWTAVADDEVKKAWSAPDQLSPAALAGFFEAHWNARGPFSTTHWQQAPKTKELFEYMASFRAPAWAAFCAGIEHAKSVLKPEGQANG